jgi:hypothetical protein
VAWGGVPLAWLLLRHTVCAPWRRVVRGCICCAPACLFFLHYCAYLRFWLLVSAPARVDDKQWSIDTNYAELLDVACRSITVAGTLS